MVIVNAVNFLTGRYYDVPRIAQLARELGCILGLDLAHAIGNVPLQLHDWDVDFAVWCSYKYLNGGPGAVGGCFVHERHGNDTDAAAAGRLVGQRPGHALSHAPGAGLHSEAGGRRLANQQSADPGDGAAAGVARTVRSRRRSTGLRDKSEKLTSYLEMLLDRLPGGLLKQLTPREPARRGSMLSLRFTIGRANCSRSWNGKGIVCDFREPNVIRVAPCPLYNTFHDVWRFAQALQGRGERHERRSPRHHRRLRPGGNSARLHAGQSRPVASISTKSGPTRGFTAKKPGGRSISRSRSAGSMRCGEVGLADDVVKSSILMRGRMIHARDGSLAFQPYGKDDSEALHSVSAAPDST